MEKITVYFDSKKYSIDKSLVDATIINFKTALTNLVNYNASKGLAYTLNDDGVSYSVSKGTCTDANVVIASEYEGLPVTSIGDSAFSRCTSLKSITIPDSVTSIGSYAFYDCDSLVSVTIGNSVTSIGYQAFEYCTSLESITIPDSVTSISGSAFYGCTSLEYNEYDNAYYLGNDTNPYVVLVKAKDINITSCIINENTKFLCDRVFQGCTSLVSVTIPDSVTYIGDAAFDGCVNLKSLDLPYGIIEIPDWIFRDCENLESVTIPDTVMRIYMGAFQNCKNLTSLTIPDSVTYISQGAIYNCTNLVNITFNGTTAQWKAINKSYNWMDYVPAKYVQCSDGQVAI